MLFMLLPNLWSLCKGCQYLSQRFQRISFTSHTLWTCPHKTENETVTKDTEQENIPEKNPVPWYVRKPILMPLETPQTMGSMDSHLFSPMTQGHKPVSYFVQLMVGSGKPSASHTRVTDWPRLAVAFTMLCLAWTVGGTEEKKNVRGRCTQLKSTRWHWEEAFGGQWATESPPGGLSDLNSYRISVSDLNSHGILNN